MWVGRRANAVLSPLFAMDAQGVHEQVNCEPSSTEWAADGSDRESKIVFIGLGLDKDYIAKNLKECLVPEE